MNLPNKITLTRIILIIMLLISIFVMGFIPNFVAPNMGNTNINSVYFCICIVFVIAASTDFVDGYIARKYNLVTDLGKFLDPIADKILVNSMLIFILIPQSYAPNQQPSESLTITLLMACVIIMIIRDIVVDAIRIMAVNKNVVIAANKYGKMKTVFQMIAIPAILLNDYPFSLIYKTFDYPESLYICNIFMYIAALMSLISGIIYLYQNRFVFKDNRKAQA